MCCIDKYTDIRKIAHNHANHDTVRIFRAFGAEGMAEGESLQGEGVLGRHEQEQDSPSGHTAIHRCRGRSIVFRMD